MCSENLVARIRRQLGIPAEFLGADGVLRIPEVASPILTGTEASPPPLRFSGDYVLWAVMGQPDAGTNPAFAGTLVRIQYGGTEDLITDGQAGDFAPMLALFGAASKNWFEYERPRVFKDGSSITATFQNRTGANLIPWLGWRALRLLPGWERAILPPAARR